MSADPSVLFDSSALFAAIHSESGGARLILKLGEAGALGLWLGRRVLEEVESVLAAKSPKSRAYMALLLDRAGVQIGPAPGDDERARALQAVDYAPDAEVLAEALAAGADFLVSLDRKHLVGNERAASLPLIIGTPGDFLAWYRERLARSAG